MTISMPPCFHGQLRLHACRSQNSLAALHKENQQGSWEKVISPRLAGRQVAAAKWGDSEGLHVVAGKVMHSLERMCRGM